MELIHKNGEKFKTSSPQEFNFREWEQYDILEFD